MHVVERFAAWANDWRSKPIPPEVLHHAKRAVIDWHAALFPGAVMAPAILLEKALRDELDNGDATLALGRRATVRAAALINGTAAHTVEVDDIFRDGIYHPGAPTIAAALALAQSQAVDGEKLLRAVIVGYEISTRIGAAMGRAHYRFWHNTGTIGCFGACAAAAELLALDGRRFANALATATTFCAGLQQAFRMDSMSKPLHAGRAAEAGVTAALAAREGVTGSLDVIEGEAGFGRAMADGPDWQSALALQAKMGLQPAEIERVRVGTYRAGLEVAHYEAPRTPAEARFSMKYVVATALTHGSVRLAAFEPPRLENEETRSLMKRISVAVDPDLDAGFPRQRAARVAIEARGGRREELLQPTRVGDPDAPLSDRALEDKYMELAGPVLGEGPARKLLERLWRLEAAPALA